MTQQNDIPVAGRVWLVIGSLMGLLLLGIVTLSVLGHLTSKESEQEFSIDLAAGVSSIDARNGSITLVKGGSGTTATGTVVSTWLFSSPEVMVERTPQGNVITASCHGRMQWLVGCQSHITVSVPNVSTWNLKTSNGAIDIGDIEGQVDAQTRNGSIHVDAPQLKKVSAQSTNGKIRLNDVRAKDISAQSRNGSVGITAEVAPDAMNVVTKNGSIEVTVPRGSTYQVSTNVRNGSVENEVGNDPSSAHRLDLKTGNGSIEVRSR